MTTAMTTPAALDALVSDALSSLDARMTAVRDVLEDTSRSEEFVHQEAGLHLFAASVVLHLKPQEVAQLIAGHGLTAVAEAFQARFERPIIESEQLAAFTDVLNASWAAFWNWSQALWSTVEQQAVYQNDIDRLVHDVFNHDKGYNRAINFAQTPAAQAIMGPPTLSETTGRHPAPNPTATTECALWLYQCLHEAELITQAPTWQEFTDAVTTNWSDLNAKLGYQGDAAQLLPPMRSALDDMSLLS